jgi:hypothetical protein
MTGTQYYTPQMLIEHAKRQTGVKVSTRQIEEWHAAGLLPEPVRVKMPGQGRGRAPYQYPEPAPAAVVWLGEHRKYIDGNDVAAFWMWLEGFDYIQIDPAAVVRARIEALWRVAQQEAMPSLPAIESVAGHGLTEDEIAALLDEMDRNVTDPMMKTEQWDFQTAPQAEMVAGLFGVMSPALSTGVDSPERTMPTATAETIHADAVLSPAASVEQRRSLEMVHPQLIQAGQLTLLYRGLAAGDVRFAAFRAAWKMFTPETIPDFWHALPLVAVFRGADKPKTRADMMRFYRYDPYLLMLHMIVLVAAQNALNPTQTGKEETAQTR